MNENKIKTEILNKVMLDEFGESWKKGYFEETNMHSTAETVKRAIQETINRLK